MRLPRFTTRRLMVLVAAVAVLMAAAVLMLRRSVQRNEIADEHQRKSEIANLNVFLLKSPRNGELLPSQADLIEGDRWWSRCLHHQGLAMKYREFAHRPWLPVPPDPLPPE